VQKALSLDRHFERGLYESKVALCFLPLFFFPQEEPKSVEDPTQNGPSKPRLLHCPHCFHGKFREMLNFVFLLKVGGKQKNYVFWCFFKLPNF
jgi:hypothetical protein